MSQSPPRSFAADFNQFFIPGAVILPPDGLTWPRCGIALDFIADHFAFGRPARPGDHRALPGSNRRSHPNQGGLTPMQFQISGRHMALTPAIDGYARRKAAKLLRHFDRIQQVDILIDRAKNAFAVEIITDVEHHEPFVAKMSHADLYASIDLAIDKAVRQLSDHKKKLRNNKHHPSTHHTPSGIRAYETA